MFHRRPSQAGACVDARQDEEQTPLHVAARYNDVDVVRALIDTKADVEAVDKLGRTPLHHATINKDNCVNVVQLLIEKDSNVKALDKQNYTALCLAAINNL